MDGITDKYECIRAVIENKSPETLRDLINNLESLFANDSGLITLATGHKAKGLEWDTVIHLDPWRIPSKWAKKEDEITQENNLRYVLETRTKHTLILANFQVSLQRLYTAKRKDPDLDILQISRSPTSPTHIWIVKTDKPSPQGETIKQNPTGDGPLYSLADLLGDD